VLQITPSYKISRLIIFQQAAEGSENNNALSMKVLKEEDSYAIWIK